MTDLAPLTPTRAQPAPSPVLQSSPSSRATLSSDFETFLQMLTTQARFQDPLDPVSSSDYAAQLAQFSMVEQQVFTNEQLTALAGAMGGNTISSMANWVGLEARAVTSAAFSGQPITVSTGAAAGADLTELVVYDAGGTERARFTLPPDQEEYQWAGLDQSDAVLPPGQYAFSLESFSRGERIETRQAAVYARVTEAQIAGDAILLRFDGGGVVPADQVTALREPDR